MSASTRYFSGVACVLGYIALASSQSVALSRWLASSNVYLVAGLSFIVVMSLFGTIATTRAGLSGYGIVMQNRRLLVALNVAGTCNWLFYFLAVKYLTPAVAVTLTQGVGPISMTAYRRWRQQRTSRVTLRAQVVIFVAATAMCAYVVSNRVTNGGSGRATIAAAIAIAVICSISITTTIVLSRTFADSHVPASVVLSIRFPLLIAVCFVVLPTQQHVHLDAQTAAVAGLVGLVGVGGGAYMLQRGVELAPPLAVSTCLAVSPLVVFIIGLCASANGSNEMIFVLIAVIVAASLISVIHDGRQLRQLTEIPATPGTAEGSVS